MPLGNITNFGVFAAITWAVYRGEPLWKMSFFLFVVLGGLALGFAMTLKDKARRTREGPPQVERMPSLRRLTRKINHREYSLIVLIFALLDGLHWFLWLSLGGIHLFWITLLLLNLRAGRVPIQGSKKEPS